jgi:hypothetical protein
MTSSSAAEFETDLVPADIAFYVGGWNMKIVTSLFLNAVGKVVTAENNVL